MGKWGVMAGALLLAVVGLALLPGSRAPLSKGEPATPEALAERRGALIDRLVFTRESDPGRVTGLLASGSHQAFVQGIGSIPVYRRLRDTPEADYDLAYGSSVELTLNPVGPEFRDGRLNPFHVPAIREALHRLVDREHIAEELYGGLAVPRWLPISTAFPDYARLAETARALELRYAHDPAAAEATIAREMRALGATLEAGRWRYRGAPVTLILLIRNDDERRRVGDYLANQLEDIGFTVERRYRNAEEASRLWIASDPAAGQWHLYTGGWISIVMQRDQAQNFSDFFTPRGRAELLWQAYAPSPEFDALAERLERRDYADWAERQALMARALELAMEDSVRLWLVDRLSVSARASNVSVAADLAGGLAGSALWPYTLRYEERLGGEMVFGTPGLLTEPWNPIAGSNWIFDRMITRALADPPLLPDPYTGLYRPQRLSHAEVTVAEGVTLTRSLDWLNLDHQARILVPEDAWLAWDAGEGRLVTVGETHPEGLGARTRVRLHYEAGYLEQRWHDGSRRSVADLLLPWILAFERADEASPLFDAAHQPTFEAYRQHFRGWRILDTEPLIIEAYSDQAFPDAETLVAARAPQPLPWHTLALGILAERHGELAFSSHQADRRGIDWLNLVAGPSLAILRRYLDEARSHPQAHHSLPFAAALSPWVEEAEVEARFVALDDWVTARGHFWVGDGPFELAAVYPLEGSLVLRRFADFPDPADKWLALSRAALPELATEGPLVVAPGEPAEVRLAVTQAGEPYPEAALEGVRYLLFDGQGRLMAQGAPRPLGDGEWGLTLDAETLAALGAGANRLEFILTSHWVALPSFASHLFATLPADAEEIRP
ncbi:ABC transporter substrate-binding protein [Halomonas sp. 328]|uniref:ABC transporter substrate-binding protein n=1 Tax=Halomonas sp. 328 TaxID=2776704 RepID=UPI0018A74C09|nr:ABC transporter substrate-binding protein [Halomonas sp. 328]MBF8221059.1 ABC transporter substrate-binding protein [Halomonas sp. 328]